MPIDNMLQRFRDSLKKIAGEDFRDKKYLLAVSGGADSTVMATLFSQTDLKFAIAHCNFHLRGNDSNRDMEFVKNLAQQLESQLFIKEFDTFSEQKDSGKSIEMTARDLRYFWFGCLMTDFDFLVTAHNCNDAAETSILNLTRGASLKGLCSIPQKNGSIIRPMLCFSAKEIRNFANKNNIPFVEDYTNSDETIKRNRIRHSVITILEEQNPNFLRVYDKNRQILSKQYNFYLKYLQKEIDEIVTVDDGIVKINIEKLNDSSDSNLILYEILSKYGFSADIVTKLSETGDFQVGKNYFSETHKLVIDRNYILIGNIENESEETIFVNSLEELGNFFCIEEDFYRKDIVFDKNPYVFYIPEDKLHFPLQIRHWRYGDYFYPLGANGRKKLSDFFATAKVDSFRKRKTRILCEGNNIMWLIGLRSDDRYKVDSSTKKYFILTDITNNNEK